MSELTARFRVSLEGGDQFTAWVDKSIAGVRQLERSHTTAMTVIGRNLRQTTDDVARMGVAASKTALSVSGLSLGLAAQSRSVLDFRDNVNRLATTANLAQDQIGGLRNQILDVAVASGQMKEGVSDALNEFVAKTGNIETARKNLELYAKTATATSAAISDVSLIGAELSTKMGIANQRTALGILAKQSDVGAIEFRHLASQGPRMFAAAAGAGLHGEEGVRRIGGLAQLFAEGVGGAGSARSVATSIEGLFRDVSKKTGQKRIAELGIEVGDRDAIEIVKDVVRKFGGNLRKIQNTGIFQATSMRGVGTLAKTFRETGEFAKLDEFTNVSADDSVIGEKFARNISSGKMALAITQNRADRAFDQNLGDSVENLARRSGSLASAYEWATANPGTVAGGAGAALLARNIFRNYVGGGGGGGVGGLLGGGIQRVTVTNWPSGGGGLGGLGAAAVDATQKLSTLKMAAQNASLLLATLGAGYAVGSYIDEKTGASKWAADKARKTFHADEIDAYEVATGVMGHRAKLGAEEKRKREQIAALEKGGLSHGMAVYRAEHPETGELVEAVKGIQQPIININVHPDGTVTADSTGTRKPNVKMRRGGTQ